MYLKSLAVAVTLTIGVVGGSGSGKTTVTRALYDGTWERRPCAE